MSLIASKEVGHAFIRRSWSQRMPGSSLLWQVEPLPIASICCEIDQLSLSSLTDQRKLQPRLLTAWPTIPIEVEPLAARSVLAILSALGSPAADIRTKGSSALKTDQENYIIDAPFHPLLLRSDVEKSQSLHPMHKGLDGKGDDGKWEVETLAREIKAIEGVLSVGLFVGENGLQAQNAGKRRGGQKPVAAYFGYENGRVQVRNSKETGEAWEVIQDPTADQSSPHDS